MMFSIVIPTFNRSRQILNCLDSICKLNYPVSQFEVIVVDDGSSPPLHTVIEVGKFPFQLQVLHQENAGPGMARNYGATMARGRWLAFTDDDCLPRPNWLKDMQSALEESPAALIAGTTRNGCTDNICAFANQLLLDSVCAWLFEHAPELSFYPSNNLACDRLRFLEIGGFHAKLYLAAGEDREICMRWAGLGGGVLKQSGAVVEHRHAQNLTVFTKMHFRYGRGARMLLDTSYHQRRKVPKLGLYFRILSAPFGKVSMTRSMICVVLLAWSQVVTAIGFASHEFVTVSSNNKARSRSST